MGHKTNTSHHRPTNPNINLRHNSHHKRTPNTQETRLTLQLTTKLSPKENQSQPDLPTNYQPAIQSGQKPRDQLIHSVARKASTINILLGGWVSVCCMLSYFFGLFDRVLRSEYVRFLEVKGSYAILPKTRALALRTSLRAASTIAISINIRKN